MFHVGRVRLLASAVALVCALGLALHVQVASAAPTCSEVYSVKPHGKAPNHKRPPLLIGDSVIGFAIPALTQIGYRINAQGCRSFQKGIRALKKEARKRKLPRTIVFAVGAVGTAGKRKINKVLRFIGPKRTLVLVTPRTIGGGIDKDAKNYHRAAARHPDRVKVVPWAEETQGHPEWFYGDGVHPNEHGVIVLSVMLAQALHR